MKCTVATKQESVHGKKRKDSNIKASEIEYDMSDSYSSHCGPIYN